MSSVHLYTILVKVPGESSVFILHNSHAEETTKWNPEVRDRFLLLRDAMLRESADPNLASLGILPYYARVAHPTGRIKTLYHPRPGDITILRPAGTPEEPGGLRLCLIHKEPGHPRWKNDFWIETDYTRKQLDSIEIRSNREFLRQVAERKEPPADNLKVVAVPGDADVRLTKNSQGEYISENPRTWA